MTRSICWRETQLSVCSSIATKKQMRRCLMDSYSRFTRILGLAWLLTTIHLSVVAPSALNLSARTRPRWSHRLSPIALTLSGSMAAFTDSTLCVYTETGLWKEPQKKTNMVMCKVLIYLKSKSAQFAAVKPQKMTFRTSSKLWRQIQAWNERWASIDLASYSLESNSNMTVVWVADSKSSRQYLYFETTI